ncbi:MAG: hypothetical protein ACLQAN_08740 [Acidimicrobiales bacterium]
MTLTEAADTLAARNDAPVYGRVPEFILNATEITDPKTGERRPPHDGCARLFATLDRYGNDRGAVKIIKRKTLADRLGWSLDKLDRVMADLCALGGVQIQAQTRAKTRDRGPNLYVLDFAPGTKVATSTDAQMPTSEVAADSRLRGRKDAARVAAGMRQQRESIVTESTKTETSLAATPSARPRDLLFKALAEVCEINLAEIIDRGAINKARSKLASVNASPDEIRVRATRYREKFRDAALTPNALVKWWPSLSAPSRTAAPEGRPKIEPLRMTDDELAVLGVEGTRGPTLEAAAPVEALTPRESVATGQLGAHNRWHVERRIVNPDCSLCRGDPAAPETLAPRESIATGTLGAHNRWHVARGVMSPGCPHCAAALTRGEP